MIERARSPAGAVAEEAAVVCAGLTYRFGDHVAVNGVDLEIRPGETFGLLGPNGAGKTTTIRMLTTLLKPAAGRVSVFGADAAARPMLVRRMIGYVPQLLSADGTLTGRENVELFARLFDVPRGQRAARVADALAAMGLADAG
jgi:ABC-2 type transport system ATP-binding protein